jgi:hypothetical protein
VSGNVEPALKQATVYSKERLALFGPERTATPLPGGP